MGRGHWGVLGHGGHSAKICGGRVRHCRGGHSRQRGVVHPITAHVCVDAGSHLLEDCRVGLDVLRGREGSHSIHKVHATRCHEMVLLSGHLLLECTITLVHGAKLVTSSTHPVLSYRFQFHSNTETFLKSTEWTSLPLTFVDVTASVVNTGIHFLVLHSSLKESFTTFTGEQAIVIARNLVSTDRAQLVKARLHIWRVLHVINSGSFGFVIRFLLSGIAPMF